MKGRKVSTSIVGGGSLFLEIMNELVHAMRELGGSDEDILYLASPEGKKTVGQMARLAVGQVSGAFRVTVDYGAPLEDMIGAGGYDWVNPQIVARNYAITGSGTRNLDVVLLHFDRAMSTEEISKEMERRELRPVLLEELLAFGARYPGKQHEFPIVALGSIWRASGGYRGVVYLHGDEARRELVLYWIEDEDWTGRWRFAATPR